MSCFNSRAQGTLEYLVIIAIVVVISLVLAGIVLSQINSVGNVLTVSSQIKNKIGVGSISILDTVADNDGNGLVVLKNLGSETVFIEKIKVDGVDHNYGGKQLVFGEQINFSLENIGVCDGLKKSYSIIIYYTNSLGVIKTADFETITLDCVENTTPIGAFVEETVNGVIAQVGHFCGELSTVGYDGVISNCNDPISAAGNYILDRNLSCSLAINADDVNINGNYCTLTGDVNASRLSSGANAYTDLNLNNITVVGNIYSVGGNGVGDYDNGGNGGSITIIDSNVINVFSTGGYSGLSNDSGGNGGTIRLIDSNATTITSAGGNSIQGNCGDGGLIIITDSNIGNITSIGGQGFYDGLGGTITIAGSNTGNISSLGGYSQDGISNAGSINITNSNVLAVLSQGGNSLYGQSGSGGQITLSGSTATTVSSLAATYCGDSTCYGGNGGAINIINSNATAITSMGGRTFEYNSISGSSGLISITNSIVTTVSSTGGNSDYGDAGSSGGISITGALTQTGVCSALGGNSTEGLDSGGNGGNITISPTCPILGNIGAFTCTGGAGFPSGSNGTCPHTCS